MVYDKSLASEVGEDIISARLLLTAENENTVTAFFSIKTDEYSKENAKYGIILEYPDGDKTVTGTVRVAVRVS